MEKQKHILNNSINLASPNESTEVLKKKLLVSFHPIANVILVPTCQEFHDALLVERLWWSCKELQSFKLEAKQKRFIN